MNVFHFELRASVHVAHAFNLGPAELERAVLDDWRRGREVAFGDRRWAPDRAKLKIYEGRRLEVVELSFGRGWGNAVKHGEDVTGRLLSPTTDAPAPASSSALDALRREVLAQCAGGPIGVHQVLLLTNRWYPERRVSERLALAEAAVWGLLHEHRVSLRRLADDQTAPDAVAPADWEAILLDWRTWADVASPGVLIEAASASS